MVLIISRYTKELSKIIILDIANIIISYMPPYKDIFEDNFISECIANGDYLYYNKNNTTLIHYLFEKNRIADIKKLLENSNYLEANNFQNKDKNGSTELYWLCQNKMHKTIATIIFNCIDGGQFSPKHFQNTGFRGRTELHCLCRHNMGETIALIGRNFVAPRTFWKPKHFQNKDDYGRTELYLVCYKKMYETIALIGRHFVYNKDGHKVLNIKQSPIWEAKHFQNKNKAGQTELYWLCINRMQKSIVLINGNFVDGEYWKKKYFQNEDKHGDTEFVYLYHNKMHKAIALIIEEPDVNIKYNNLLNLKFKIW